MTGVKQTILVVDDEEMVCEVTSTILRKQGYEVLTAEDGEAAIDAFTREGDRIDLVILDLTMPKMNGKEAFQKLRSLRQDVKVIISSGIPEEDSRKQFLEEEVSGFLQKPFVIKKLLCRVQRCRVNTPGKRTAAGRHRQVIRPGEPGNAVKQDDHVPACLHHSLGSLQ